MKLKKLVKPSILFSELFYPWSREEEKMFEAIKRISEDEYYQSMEIGPIKSSKTRSKIAKIKEDKEIVLTHWLTPALIEQGLNPSTIDSSLRKQTIAALKELVDIASECGINNVALISGEDPGLEKREEARKGLEEVIFSLCHKASEYEGMNVLIEPLDRGKHKNNLIGPIKEAVDLLDKIHSQYSNLYLSWDSAHAALNEEDLMESIEFANDRILQIHLSNAVLDKDSELYGDNHMDIGAPGFLDDQMGYNIINKFAHVTKDHPLSHYASVEVRTPAGEDPFEYEKRSRTFLKNILEKKII